MGVTKVKGNQSKRSRNTRTESKRSKIGRQPATTERNRKIKRLRHIRNHPNDAQTAKLL